MNALIHLKLPDPAGPIPATAVALLEHGEEGPDAYRVACNPDLIPDGRVHMATDQLYATSCPQCKMVGEAIEVERKKRERDESEQPPAPELVEEAVALVLGVDDAISGGAGDASDDN